tara:strand:- start:1317 stop:2300 length:984 start_codon:yes stop_codon:yes gene_type:complete
MNNSVSSYNASLNYINDNSFLNYTKKNNTYYKNKYLYNFMQDKKVIYCKNCGKHGHPYKRCKEPITSYGIICVKLIDKNTNKLVDYNNIITDNIQIQYLLIQRKHTLGYIEFIRGKYFISDLYSIIILFKQMVQEEIDSIINNDFDYHWCKLWVNKINKSSIYKNEYENSKKKFNYLKLNKHDNINLNYIIQNNKPLYNSKEWGMPKGRRNNYEEPIQCAVREFEEETSYDKFEYKLLNSNKEFIEIFNGTNGVKYQHIYYVGICTTNRIPNLDSNFTSNEIGNITWETYSNTCKMLRPYHKEKIRIITDINNILRNHINNNYDKIK